MTIETMKLAWEVFELVQKEVEWQFKSPVRAQVSKAQEALRAAIEAAEKPVAWADKYDIEREGHDFYVNRQQPTKDGVPLYTAPQQEKQEPVAWADKCRIELVTTIHTLASDYENALGAFRYDAEAIKKANGDISYAKQIASRWNWGKKMDRQCSSCGGVCKKSGCERENVKLKPTETAPPQREWQGLTDEFYEQLAEKHVTNCYFDTLIYAKAIEQALKEKNNG